MIIGIVGHPASGKDTASLHLEGKGYFHIALGEVIRDNMRALGLPVDRGSIHDFVLKKRAELGNSYPSKDVAVKIMSGAYTTKATKADTLKSDVGNTALGNVVVSGFRNVEEVKYFQQELGKKFALISIDAPIKARYERAKARGRIGDDISFERFKKEDEQEKAKSTGSYDVDGAIAMADTHIVNDGSIEDLFKNIDAAVSRMVSAAVSKMSDTNVSEHAETPRYTIYKIGGVLIKDRKLLVCRSKGKDAFIAPGGKVEKGEQPLETLKRELMEEVGVSIEEAAQNTKLLGTFYAPAAYDPQNILRMDVFIVNSWQGEPQAGSEVEEIRWINTITAKDIKVGSIFEHDVIPKLKELDLID